MIWKSEVKSEKPDVYVICTQVIIFRKTPNNNNNNNNNNNVTVTSNLTVRL
jgi:hypothetical protein